MNFQESMEAAIKEAVELNKEQGFYRWKSVSMSSSGDWFADESTIENFEKCFENGFFMAKSGNDISLKTVCRDNAKKNWVKSLSFIPNDFI